MAFFVGADARSHLATRGGSSSAANGDDSTARLLQRVSRSLFGLMHVSKGLGGWDGSQPSSSRLNAGAVGSGMAVADALQAILLLLAELSQGSAAIPPRSGRKTLAGSVGIMAPSEQAASSSSWGHLHSPDAPAMPPNPGGSSSDEEAVASHALALLACIVVLTSGDGDAHRRGSSGSGASGNVLTYACTCLQESSAPSVFDVWKGTVESGDRGDETNPQPPPVASASDRPAAAGARRRSSAAGGTFIYQDTQFQSRAATPVPQAPLGAQSAIGGGGGGLLVYEDTQFQSRAATPATEAATEKPEKGPNPTGASLSTTTAPPPAGVSSLLWLGAREADSDSGAGSAVAVALILTLMEQLHLRFGRSRGGVDSDTGRDGAACRAKNDLDEDRRRVGRGPFQRRASSAAASGERQRRIKSPCQTRCTPIA